MNANEVLVPRINEALDDVARIGVLIPCPSDIVGYLLSHPDLTPILIGLSRAAREQLPPDAQLSLELYRDPEIDDAYPTLYVQQWTRVPDLLHRTDVIMEPFFPQLETCSGWVLLTTDYRPPR